MRKATEAILTGGFPIIAGLVAYAGLRAIEFVSPAAAVVVASVGAATCVLLLLKSK